VGFVALVPLSPTEITTALTGLPGWSLEEDALARTFVFSDFRVAFEAEDLGHHPDWSNGYNRVQIRLCTHDAGNQVTRQDVELAQRIHRLAGHR
jgi:4a-hydroxytetrahydrobiopterin dehydratase